MLIALVYFPLFQYLGSSPLVSLELAKRERSTSFSLSNVAVRECARSRSAVISSTSACLDACCLSYIFAVNLSDISCFLDGNRVRVVRCEGKK